MAFTTSLALAAVLSSALAAPVPAATADETSVTWSTRPASADGPDSRSWVAAEVEPGESVTDYLAITNYGDEPTDFALSAADGYFTNTGRFNMLQTGEKSSGAGTWIDIVDRVVVDAKSTEVVPYTIRVPDNATPGDVAAGVAASVTSAGEADGGSRVGVESRVGFRVMLRVAGELRPALSVEPNNAQYRWSWNPFSPGSAEVTYTLKNTGNSALSVVSQVSAWGRPGEPSTGDVPAELLPGESREMTHELRGIWPVVLSAVEVSASGASTIGEAPAAAASASSMMLTLPVPQLLLLTGLTLLAVAWLSAQRRRRRSMQTLVEAARREGALDERRKNEVRA